jgi:photosynthetic reaction center H subunit
MKFVPFTQYVDLTQLLIYAFWLFFAGLIFYLQRESRREGYPLVDDMTGQSRGPDPILLPDPKTFRLAGGRTVTVPNAALDSTGPVNGTKLENWYGSPLIPNGDAMASGIGPGTYVNRPDIADVTYEGHNRIVPMRVATTFSVNAEDTDPRGLPVYAADGAQAGTVKDLWIDRSEYLIRYLEIETTGGKRVLAPINFVDTISGERRRIDIDSLNASHFANVPGLKNPDSVTMLEEEKIVAYYGAGTLYRSPDIQEPLL